MSNRDYKFLSESLNNEDVDSQLENFGTSKVDVLNRMHSFRKRVLPENQTYWAEADIDTRFEAGDQVLWNKIYAAVQTIDQSSFTFNRVRRIVNLMSGHQRQNRKSIIATPIENADEETASQFSKLLLWVTQRESLLELFSESFRDSLIPGLSLLELAMDYTHDPVSGDIKINKCNYNSFLIDPYFKKPDLSDCEGILRRSYLRRSECKLLQPAKAEIIEKMRFMDKFDGYFEGMVEGQDLAKNRLFAYDEFYYKAYRQKRILTDKDTGEVTEWRGNSEQALQEYLSLYPQIILTETTIPTVNLTVVINDQVMYDGHNPQGLDVYPFVPFFADYNPNIKDFALRIQGIVRGLRDPQFLYNRRKIIELNILESQITAGKLYRPDYLIDKKSIHQVGEGKNIAVKKDTPPLDDVVKSLPAAIWDPNIPSVSANLGDEMEINVGLTKEAFGTEDKDISGITAAYRHRAATAGMQGWFDGLDRSMQYVGDRIISLMQLNFTPGKVQRITEEQPTVQFYDRAFGRYDCIVEDGLNTATQRQMQFAQLLQLKEVGVNIPGELLVEAAPVQNKKALREAVAKVEQQVAEAEQRKLEGDMIEQEARTKLAESRAYADEGLGSERISRIQENEALAAERYAEAAKDRALGELNIAKTLKELDDVDISQMEKLLNIALMMKTEEQVDKQQGTQRSAADQGAARAIASTPSRARSQTGSSGGVSQSVAQGKTVSKLGGVRPEAGNVSR